jgi:hypothetical protein
MTQTVLSKSGVEVRLTDERWAHITEEHCELAGFRLEVLQTLSEPDRILAGGAGEMLAVRELFQGKHMVLIYRKQVEDGFVIREFLTTRTGSLNRRQQLWTK